MRSEWTRATLTVATTLVDLADYSLPAALDNDAGERLLEVYVDGKDYTLASAQIGREIANGELNWGGWGLYWISFDQSGVEQLTIYPPPTASALEIKALCVVEPAELVNGTDVPVVPSRFRYAIVDYAAAKAYGFLEDNPELRAFHMQEFDSKVDELAALRNSREGRGPVQLQVQGIHY